jgi:hypothetical protein
MVWPKELKKEKERYQLIRQMTLHTIRTYQCRTIRELYHKLQSIDKSITVEEIRDAIKDLVRENQIEISEPILYGNFSAYLIKSLPFLLTTTTTLIAFVTVYLLPYLEPWSSIRIIAAGAFVFFVPGYALSELIFSTRKVPSYMERVTSSIVFSLIFTPTVGLVLNYSSIGLSLNAILIVMSLSSISIAVVGIYRKFWHVSTSSRSRNII